MLDILQTLVYHYNNMCYAYPVVLARHLLVYMYMDNM